MKKILACILFASLAACETLFAPEPGPGVSTFAFSHSGFGGQPADLYEAEGEAAVESGPPPLGDWAFALRSGFSRNPVMVMASRRAGGERFDVVRLHLPYEVRRGDRLSIAAMCEAAPDCAQMTVGFGVHPRTEMPETGCIVQGEARVLTISDRRAAGTFRGMANCTGARDGQTQIRDGTFDVALVTRPGI